MVLVSSTSRPILAAPPTRAWRRWDPKTWTSLRETAIANVALNVIGNRNRISRRRWHLPRQHSTVGAGRPEFRIPNGSDNDITTTGTLSVALIPRASLANLCTVAPCGNTVTRYGPVLARVAAGVVSKIVEGGHRSQFRPGQLRIPTTSNWTTWLPNTLADTVSTLRSRSVPLPRAIPTASRPRRSPAGMRRQPERVTDEQQQAVQLLAQEVECRRPESPRRLGEEEAKQ